MNQPTLMNMPPRKVTFAIWVEEWMTDHYPEVQTKKTSSEIIEEMYGDVPQRWLGSADEAVRSRFTTRVQAVFGRITPRRSFLALTPGGGKQDRVIIQPMLFALDDFRRYEVGKLALAKDDLSAVERDVEQYASKHPAAIPNVAAFMTELRMAVGL